jgi:hypothetical protein
VGVSDGALVRMEQLDDVDVFILREVEAGKRPKWKNITELSSTYKTY